MRILLDECVPSPMRDVLSGHNCETVRERGWGGIKNGELLRLAEDQFDLFITAGFSNNFRRTSPIWPQYHVDCRGHPTCCN